MRLNRHKLVTILTLLSLVWTQVLPALTLCSCASTEQSCCMTSSDDVELMAAESGDVTSTGSKEMGGCCASVATPTVEPLKSPQQLEPTIQPPITAKVVEHDCGNMTVSQEATTAILAVSSHKFMDLAVQPHDLLVSSLISAASEQPFDTESVWHSGYHVAVFILHSTFLI